MQVFNTHRKCMVCKSTTTDLSQDKCRCGAYMHLVGFLYEPKVQTKGTEQIKAAAS